VHVAGNEWIGGYVRSGKGRWPTGSIHGNAQTENTIFDTLAPYIPNTNDEILICGSLAGTGLESMVMIASKAKRYDSTTIYIYILTYNGTATSTTTVNIPDGGASTYDISIAW
jgi:hypothetical protein